MSNLHIMCGLPASGKTTYISKWAFTVNGSILTNTSPVLRTRSMATSLTPAAMRPLMLLAVALTSGSTRPLCPMALHTNC